MSQHVGVMARRAFQQNHFLLVDAGKPQGIGLHQVRPLVDSSRSIRSVGKERLPAMAQVSDLVGAGYCSIPRLFAVKAHGLVDVQKEHGVMHRFAGLCAAIMQRSDPVHAKRWRALLGAQIADSIGPISVIQFMKIANGVAEAVRDSALSLEMSDGAVYVSNADVGAQIFVELDTRDPKRAPQLARINGMYTCKGSGPVHLIGGVEAMVVSRSPVEIKAGIREDDTAARYAYSGLPLDAIEDMHLQIVKEDNNALFLQQSVAEGSMPIPNHGVMMRAMAGAVGVWKGDNLIHVLNADNGTTLLCHPDAQMVQLKATTPTARLLKIPFKLN